MFIFILRAGGRGPWLSKVDPSSKKVFNDVSLFRTIHFHIHICYFLV
jgi:hypothetical protein